MGDDYPASPGRQYVFLSPQADLSGAPQIVLGIIEEFAETYDRQKIRLITAQVWPDQLTRLNATGVRVDRSASLIGPRLIKRQLGLRKSDFVLLNGSAVPPNYRRFVIRSLAAGQLDRAVWLIPEDVERFQLVASDVVEPKYRGLLRDLIASDRLAIRVPSHRSKAAYDAFLDTDRVEALRLRVDLADSFREPRFVDDYRRVEFVLMGAPSDGRRGHLVALFAFQRFLRLCHDGNPDRYRPFGLTFVGLGDDYVSEHCRRLGGSLLGDRFRTYPRMSHEDAVAVSHGCNVTICCSLSEAFPLSVAEGMAMGHVVVRNDSGGVDEQLAEGANGYRVDSEDIGQFAAVIEELLNTAKTSAETLHSMGQHSQEMIAPYLTVSYLRSLLGAGADGLPPALDSEAIPRP